MVKALGKHPVSLYSHLYSSHEKDFKSTNHVPFQGLNQVIDSLLEKFYYYQLAEGVLSTLAYARKGWKKNHTNTLWRS
jgi:hypothetical protein